MKTTTNKLAFAILAIIWGCGEPTNQDKNSIAKDETIHKTITNNNQTNIETEKQIVRGDTIDSLRIEIALKDAFKFAQTKFKNDNFSKQYELQPDDSSYIIYIEIEIGKLFKDQNKYCLLRRQVPWATYLDLYKINGDKTEKLIETMQSGMSYIKDTIFEVDGDGHKDFLIHSYPSSGCCIRDIYDVYLNLPEKGIFSENYQFINPTFSADEKIIRGIEYGHPGEVGLYKYKWNGLQVDTIEFIYPNVNLKGQFIKTKSQSYRPTEKEGIILKTVPKEYHKIENYDWFSDF